MKKQKLTIGILALMMLSVSCNLDTITDQRATIEAQEAIIEAYNETAPKLYTEEDMNKAIEMSYNAGLFINTNKIARNTEALEFVKAEDLSGLKILLLK